MTGCRQGLLRSVLPRSNELEKILNTLLAWLEAERPNFATTLKAHGYLC